MYRHLSGKYTLYECFVCMDPKYVNKKNKKINLLRLTTPTNDSITTHILLLMSELLSDFMIILPSAGHKLPLQTHIQTIRYSVTR